MCLPPVGERDPGLKTNSRIRHRRHKGSQAGTGRHPQMRREDGAAPTSGGSEGECVATSAPQTSEIAVSTIKTQEHIKVASWLPSSKGILERIPRLHLHFDWFVSLKLKENPSKKGQKYQINAKPPTGFDFWQTLLL